MVSINRQPRRDSRREYSVAGATSGRITNTHKMCTKCFRTQLLTEFHAHKGRADGKQLWCKSCVSEYGRNKRAKNSPPVPVKLERYALLPSVAETNTSSTMTITTDVGTFHYSDFLSADDATEVRSSEKRSWFRRLLHI